MRRAGISTACAVACAVALVAGQAGCGTTNIITTNPRAKIYVNGELVGQGTGEIRKRGGPGSTTIVVKTPDGQTATKQIKRKFTGTTFLVGFITYFVGWFAAWEYPGTVMIPVEESAAPAGSSWGDGGDAWSRPPPGWQPPPQGEPAPAQPGVTPAPTGAPAPSAPTPAAPAPAPSKSWDDAPGSPR